MSGDAALSRYTLTHSEPVVPQWALEQVSLKQRLSAGAHEFVARYTGPDGTLTWRESWPGMDGSDDPYEAFQYLALFYALTGDESVYELARKMWESITWQWTQYGQIHREFDGYYDWMHHGEANLFHYFFGLTKPESLQDRTRADRFARMYTGEDPEAPNYDTETGIIRAPQSGSRGPRLQVTKEDLGTHRGVLDDYLAPFEDMKTSPFALGTCNWSDDAVFDEVVRLMNERTTRGDVPLNMNATGQMAHAYMYSGDESLKDWITDYLLRWRTRAIENGGILPDNVGLSGKVGEYLDGKWWGGHYGWRWPHGFLTIIEPTINACSNAYLLTGDSSFLALAREQIDANYALGEDRDGMRFTPHKHFDAGWTDFRPITPFHSIHLWTKSLAKEDQDRVERSRGGFDWSHVSIAEKPFSAKHYNTNTTAWYEYITGNLPNYPLEVLAANNRLIDQQLARMRSGDGDPLTWDTVEQINGYPDSLSMQVDGYAIHAWQEFCPVYFESLVQLQWGAPMHISHGGFQHATFRYYNSATQRPGLPDSVAALVTRISATDADVQLANTGDEEVTIVIQAGAFGEHLITGVSDNAQDSAPLAEPTPWLEISVPGNVTVSLRLTMDRYSRTPRYDTPWSSRADWSPLIKPREPRANPEG